MRSIVWLNEIKKEDIAIAGGKGANLGEMYQAGLPVPNAFIITSKAFKNFLEEAGIKKQISGIISSITMENTKELDEKAKKIREIIINSDMPVHLEVNIEKAYATLTDEDGINSPVKEPVFVAVRSSATTEDLKDASFAGQQESYLNVKGNSNLLESVKKCWASLFTARAIYYRAKQGFDSDKALIAVVVQKMINSEKAGVIFTANPLTNNRDEIVAEAVFGLGEGLGLGEVEPDHYVFDKSSGRIKETKIGTKNFVITRDSSGKNIQKELHDEFKVKQVVYDHELKLIFDYAKKIELHYGSPQDIEFAFESGNFYITQSRPITTLDKKIKKSEDIGAKSILEGSPASPGVASGKVKIIHSLAELEKMQKGDILVTKMTNPDMVVSMQKASGIVTNEGGSTCHAAIVSRELGIPCIVGTKKATEILKENEIITVDGTHGKVYEGIHGIKVEMQEIPKEAIPENVREAWKKAHEKPKSVLIKVNCDLPIIAQRAAATGADGVGLVRIEFMIAENGIHPRKYLEDNNLDDYTEVLYKGLIKIAEAFKDKPVWVRTSDIRTDEYTTLAGADSEPKESNPMIGWHGIRRSLDQEKILEAEFRAIKKIHDKGYKKVGVMIPFLISVDELKKSKEIMVSVGLVPVKEVDFGVMIETPASCMIIDELCKEGISFISFGTNDLTQLTLGVDRNNENLSSLYDEMHPAVIRLLISVINVCKRYNVKTSICGQAASRPEMAQLLIGKGISSLSVNLDSVEKIRNVL